MKAYVTTFLVLTACLFVASAAWAEEVNCLMCHPEKAEGKSVHPAVQMGCPTCHSGVDASEIPHKMSSPKGLSAEGADLCFSCHSSDKFTGKKTVHMPVMGGMCTSCHDPHSSSNDKLLISENVCFNCHDQSKFTSEKVVHVPVAGGMCTSCHNPHESDNDKLLEKNPPDLCYDCHDKTAFYGPTVHSPVGLGLCTGCHNPHQSKYPKLTVASNENLCFSCHDKTEFNKSGSVHKPVKEGKCLFCHRPHAGQNEALVYRKGNILCRKCHPDIERKPHVVAAFTSEGHPLRGRRDPNRPKKTFGCLSCHVPHSSDSKLLFRFKADSMFGLCTYCHKM